MRKHVLTMTKNNTAVIIFDTIAKAIMTIILMISIIKQNMLLTGICLILAVFMSIILRIIKAISLDMMFEIDNKIYLKPRGTRKLQEINTTECLRAYKNNTLVWNIDGIVYNTEMLPMLVDYFKQNHN